ncbi:type VI secretion system tube protein TssD [Microbacterium sp. SS28]|uniref:type VI secretion system tube protein TssD n=1 Tax=Microbacterium sp. SS28 TaxID=2919948 RepID=UPI001FAA5E19|nr:type VI secretion system tube protein TssD [Microbacterium sp. SS28]
MALNSYARLTLNGTALTGDVSATEVGGLDVSSGYVEVRRLSFGAATARNADTGAAVGRRQYEPIRILKRLDASTPLLYRALVQNEVVAGEILIFDTDPSDGSTRHSFTVGLDGGAVAKIDSVIPDVWDPAVSTWIPYEEISFVFTHLTLVHVRSGNTLEDQLGGGA